jgi:hypothetical protein
MRACSGCGASYDEDAWETLQVIESIDASELRRLVSGWPHETRVEARRCRRCSKSIAAKGHQAQPGRRMNAALEPRLPTAEAAR